MVIETHTIKWGKQIVENRCVHSPRLWCGPEVRCRRSCQRTLLAATFFRSAVLVSWNTTETMRIHRRTSSWERSRIGIAGGWTSETWWTPLIVCFVRFSRLCGANRRFYVQREWKHDNNCAPCCFVALQPAVVKLQTVSRMLMNNDVTVSLRSFGRGVTQGHGTAAALLYPKTTSRLRWLDIIQFDVYYTNFNLS